MLLPNLKPRPGCTNRKLIFLTVPITRRQPCDQEVFVKRSLIHQPILSRYTRVISYNLYCITATTHYDVMEWKHFLYYILRDIRRSHIIIAPVPCCRLVCIYVEMFFLLSVSSATFINHTYSSVGYFGCIKVPSSFSFICKRIGAWMKQSSGNVGRRWIGTCKFLNDWADIWPGRTYHFNYTPDFNALNELWSLSMCYHIQEVEGNLALA